MKIYKAQYILVRITLEDVNIGGIVKNIIMFTIAESDCGEICNLIESMFTNNILLLDSSGAKLRKVSRTVNLQGINAEDAGIQLVRAVDSAKRQAIIRRAKGLEEMR